MSRMEREEGQGQREKRRGEEEIGPYIPPPQSLKKYPLKVFSSYIPFFVFSLIVFI